MSVSELHEKEPRSFDLFTPERFRNKLRPLAPDTTVAVMLDLDKSWLGGLDLNNPISIWRARKYFNYWLGSHASAVNLSGFGLDIIPIITTQRPWPVFFGKDGLPAFREVTNIWQKRIGLNNYFDSPPMTLILAELGAIALTRQDNNYPWRVRENISLSQGLKLKTDVDILKSWLIKMGFIPEEQTSPGIFGVNESLKSDFNVRLEQGNEFYLALQQLDGSSMPEAKKTRIAGEITSALKSDADGRRILKKFKIITKGTRDIDFLPDVYASEGKNLAADLLIQLFRNSGYQWFSHKNIIAVDDQYSTAGPLFQQVLENGGYTVAVDNADLELKKICKQHKGHGLITPYSGFYGVCHGLSYALRLFAKKYSYNWKLMSINSVADFDRDMKRVVPKYQEWLRKFKK